ncbi:MAG: chemotaxis response regulator protein-glutamate methylesterase [Alphaproteobacteria bacterium]|jgi:two-component system chemotaxis response regulator CheB
MKKIKVIVIDDSKFIRTVFSGLLNQHPDIEVVDTAEDPFDARDKIKLHNPDVITLDIEMPKMDGISFLDKVMKLRPMPVIMASTLTEKGADITLRALEIGAVDYITKPSDLSANLNLDNIGRLLAEKIRIAANANILSNPNRYNSIKRIIEKDQNFDSLKLIAIGASTGGVEAIRTVLSSLPANCPPIVITQHMPERFTESFAKRLDSSMQMSVCEGRDGMQIKPGHVYIAPGDKQMQVIGDMSKGAHLKIFDSEPVSGHKPSVDVLFESVAYNIRHNAIGIMLTGMGRDGAAGMVKMKKAGGFNIGQNKDSCVVYGMPRAALEEGAIDIEQHLDNIGDTALKKCLR